MLDDVLKNIQVYLSRPMAWFQAWFEPVSSKESGWTSKACQWIKSRVCCGINYLKNQTQEAIAESSTKKQLKYLSSASVLEETSNRTLVVWSIGIISAIILLLIVWATFSTVKETAVTYGQIVPQGEVQVIQHLEGGIVRKLHVRGGEHVKQGQILAQLDTTQALSELEQMQSREVTLVIDLQRLKDFINNEKPDLDKWSKAIIDSKYNNVKHTSQIKRLLEDQVDLLNLQLKSQKDQRSVLNSQLEQRQDEFKKLEKQQKVTSNHLALLTKEKAMFDSLGKHSPISQREYLEIQREINQAQGDLNNIFSQQDQAKESIVEIQNRLHQLSSDAKETASEELGEKSAELLQVRHAIQKLEDRSQRLEIRSPVKGIVHDIEVSSGSVIQPGGLIMNVVPLDKKLVVETKITTRDIGFVKIGDPVKVKVITFDYARYGAIEGKLINISASTLLDEKEQPYYEGIVELDKEYVGENPDKNKLIPGMTVQADITTGEKSIISYILKPIQSTVGSSFSER